MLKNIVFFLSFFIFCFQSSEAQEVNKILVEADTLFNQRKYLAAYEKYDSIWGLNHESPRLLLRMAYIQEGLGNYSKALYHLGQYSKLEPSEEALLKMDELANKHALAGYSLGDEAYLKMLYFKHQRWLVPLLLALGAAGIWVLFILAKRKSARTKPAILLLAYIATCAWALNGIRREPSGIVARDGVLIMAHPAASAQLVAEVNAGHRLLVLGEEDIWVKISWNGSQAYIRKSNLWMF